MKGRRPALFRIALALFALTIISGLSFAQEEGLCEGDSLTCSILDYPFCGNGRLDEGESCDDGNLDDEDGCAGDCQEVCPLPPTTTDTTNTADPPSPPYASGSGSMPSSDNEMISERRRRRFINICPHLCSPLNALRAGSKTVTAVGLRPGLRQASPGTIAGMLRGLQFIRQMVCLLSRLGPRGAREYARLQVRLIDAIVGGLGRIELTLLQREGAAIWIRVSADCCQTQSCCVILRRRNWVQEHNWVKCLPRGVGVPTFPINNRARLARAMGACLRAALPRFSCTNTRTKYVTVNA